MRVLIAGCGYVGTALGSRLAAAGDSVFGLRRKPEGLPSAIAPVAADLAEPASLASLPGALDAVVYAASAGAREDAAYRRAYVEGVTHLLAAADAGRFLFTSSTSVHGQCEGEWVDEDSPTEPRGFAGTRVREAERIVLAGHPRPAVVRFGGIYGPGRTRLREAVAAGRFAWRPGHFTNRIHRDDCAGVLHHLLALPEAPRVTLAVDCEPAEERTVALWLARSMGVPEPGRGEPGAGPGRAAGSKRCCNRRLLGSGYTFRYPSFREGYAAIP